MASEVDGGVRGVRCSVCGEFLDVDVNYCVACGEWFCDRCYEGHEYDE